MKKKKLVMLSIPGLRMKDLDHLPNLRSMTASGAAVPISPSFPAVTCPVQTNMTTGKKPNRHGVVANGLYLHDKLSFNREFMHRTSLMPSTVLTEQKIDPCNVLPAWPKASQLPSVEMWTMPNTCVEEPQVWETLHGITDENGMPLRTAVWFALMSKFCGADNICNFAPIHNPDGSESLWCYTRPYLFYGELRDTFGHFPVKHYWGPLAGQPASKWITDAAAVGAKEFLPDYFFIYIPRLDYTPQKFGPDAPQLTDDLRELDTLLGEIRNNFTAAYGAEPVWLIAGEYAMTAVNSVTYPNRVLRELGLLQVEECDGMEYLVPGRSKSFALCDHQFSHIYFDDSDPATIEKVAKRFQQEPGIDEVLYEKADFEKYGIDHARTGDIVLISTPDSWQSYYYWTDDARAPDYARTVDIHRKPGYDPVEMFFDRETLSVPIDATLIRGSHGAPVRDVLQETVLVASDASLLAGRTEFVDVDVYDIVLRHFQAF